MYPHDYKNMSIPQELSDFISMLIQANPDEAELHTKSESQAKRWRWKTYAVYKHLGDDVQKYSFSINNTTIVATRKEE